MKRFRKCFGLKNFEQGHRHYFAHDPKFIGFESSEREPFEIIVIFQFSEPGFDTLPFMIKRIKFPRGKSEIASNGIIVGIYPQSAVFSLSAYPSDYDNSGADAVCQSNPPYVQDGDAFGYMDNPGRIHSGKGSESSYSFFDGIEIRGSSDSVPQRKLCHKEQVLQRHKCAVRPDDFHAKTEGYRPPDSLPEKIFRIGTSGEQFGIDENSSDESRKELKTRLALCLLIISGFGTFLFRRCGLYGSYIKVRNPLFVRRRQKQGAATSDQRSLKERQLPRRHGSADSAYRFHYRGTAIKRKMSGKIIF
jgi:hypothetical protein